MKKSNKTPFRVLGILLPALLLATLTAFSQPTIELVEERSRLWIEGTSTVHDINCEAGVIVGYANVGATETNDPRALQSNGSGSVKLKIPVWEFECGRRQMNRDFARALNADTHPSIEFEYYQARLLTNLEPECHPFQLEVDGKLSVAGNTREVTLIVDIEPCEANHFKLLGSKTINMRDYGIEPPSALFGLIRAHEELTVRFSLTARQTNSETNFADER